MDAVRVAARCTSCGVVAAMPSLTTSRGSYVRCGACGFIEHIDRASVAADYQSSSASPSGYRRRRTDRPLYKCPECASLGWTCELHPGQPMGHPLDDGAVCGGAGLPCRSPECPARLMRELTNTPHASRR